MSDRKVRTDEALFWNMLQQEDLRMPQLYRFDSYIIYFSSPSNLQIPGSKL